MPLPSDAPAPPFLSPDEQAALVESHQAFAVWVVTTFYPSLHGADQEDAVAEAMVGLVLAARTFDPEGRSSFRTWSILRCRTRVNDWLRRRSRCGFREAPDGFKLVRLDVPADGGSTTLAEAMPARLDPDPGDRLDAHAFLSLLPLRELAVVVATFFENMPGKELARRLGVTPQRVNQIRRRALLRIRERFATSVG